ncbi:MULTISPECIES: Rieske (2Fe-2S) protein [unclassified Pseudofrankia]|uniref:Rieske (2Fe-2S) protein n=1 Tax=unclassified Pseudofrankia TaxID=2994372 RepID=UPI0008DAA503|nr:MULTISPECIES: Rieske (2Fe-2S) protein [unclassified Pseudofrankia]MDT3439832.1 Rieske (2Fe-2S) protein [Pseudofrankia sp. BMG5.37]OHV59329.1 twin-arginine translocation pathway signal protein [Pseudofrankia sp. BMG5.36]
MKQDAAPQAEPTKTLVRPASLTRRATVPLIAVAVGASGYLVAACSSSSDDASDSPATGSATSSSAGTPSAAATDTGTAGGATTGSGGTQLATLDQVPAGGGLILQDSKIVITRGTGTDVHAFSAVCTHQGCVVAKVADGTINCPCHGSKFDASTGAPVAGPAPSPLAPVAVTVRDNAVFKA